MLEPDSELPEVYLHPGEAYVAREPTVIRTILGSCVGVTFWSARLRVGALSHAQLPRCPEEGAGQSFLNRHRYVDFAIRELARQFDLLGASRQEVQVKLFGGADVLPVSNSHLLRPTIGKLNCEAAIDTLRAEGLILAASSLGGTSGRSLRFYTGTGEVRVRLLTPTGPEDSIDG
jgi:chemotaxis protein CheD